MLKKLQELSQKAAQIKAAVDKAPETVEGLRRSLQLTAGQIHQVRADLQEAASGLRVESEEDFAEVLREINASGHVFREAGYELTCLDLEAGQWHRLILEFDRIAAVPEPTLKYLLTTHTSGVTTSSILQAFVKAEKLAAEAHVVGMQYTHLVVHVGSAPAIRLCWRTDTTRLSTPVPVASPVPTTAPVIAATATPVTMPTPVPRGSAPISSSSFATSSYFESGSRQTMPTAAAAGSFAAPLRVESNHPSDVAARAETPPAPAHASPLQRRHSSIKALGANWKEEALKKLKSSPGESKYSR